VVFDCVDIGQFITRYRECAEARGFSGSFPDACWIAVISRDFVVGGGEADLESFGFAGPVFALGFGDASQ
jgi:hypothetical protein